jgi:hypothetical protein
MRSEYRWFDFAKEPPGLDGLLAEMRNEPVGSSGSTKSTKQASQKARAPSSSGGKKCSKGTSCGATCIYSGDECLGEFPRPVSTSLTIVSRLLQDAGLDKEQSISFLSRLTGGGESAVWSSSRAKELSSTLESLRKRVEKDGGDFDETVEKLVSLAVDASSTERVKNAPMTPEEVEAIQRRVKTIGAAYDKIQKEAEERNRNGNPMSPEELREKVLPIAQSRRRSVTKEEVDFFIALLPESERNFLKTAGSLKDSPDAGRFSQNPGLDGLPESYGPLGKQGSKYADNRMRMIAGVYLAEDGKDFLTGIRIPLTHSDLEHNIPFEVGGRASEQPANMALFRSSNNGGRASSLYQDWWAAKSKVNGYKFDSSDNLTSDSRKGVVENYAKTWRQINFKNELEIRAKRAENAETLSGIYRQAREEEDKTLRIKYFTKILSNNLGVPETVAGGRQSSGRDTKRWYWLGEDTGKDESVSSRIIERVIDLYAKGDKKEIERVRGILLSAGDRVSSRISSEVKPDPKDIEPETGKPFVRISGQRGKDVKKILTEVRDEVLKEILA